jgi:hypothetical protein
MKGNNGFPAYGKKIFGSQKKCVYENGRKGKHISLCDKTFLTEIGKALV